MKKYISIIVLLSLFVIGCSEQIGVNSPVDNVNKYESKGVNSPVNNVNTNEPNWISLPSVNGANEMSAAPMSLMSMPIFQISDFIDGKKGGKIKIDEKYFGGPFGEVKVKAELKFPKKAFIGTNYITMILNTEFGNATITPHLIFEKDAIYNAEFKGLDLSGLDANEVKFVYEKEDGSYEYIETSKIEVDVQKGMLKVTNAKLPHFSRYGFVN